MVYFRLINEQIYGFISPSPYINFVVFACLSLITVAFKKLKYTEKLLAFGIFTIASYCLFLTWAQITAPQGPKVIKPLGTNGIDFTASLMFAYASHSFAAQLFIKVGNPVKFQKIAIYGYVTAFIIYTYISYGCFGNLKLTQLSLIDKQQCLTLKLLLSISKIQVGRSSLLRLSI